MYLNCTEFLIDDLDHTFNFFCGDRTRATLFTKEIHDMSGELIAALVVLLDLLLINGSDLRELVLVVRMLNSCTVLA